MKTQVREPIFNERFMKFKNSRFPRNPFRVPFSNVQLKQGETPQ